MVATLGANSEFAQVNIDNTESLESILSGWCFTTKSFWWSIHSNVENLHTFREILAHLYIFLLTW